MNVEAVQMRHRDVHRGESEMTEREQTVLRIASLKEAAAILQKHGARILQPTTCGCCIGEGRSSRISKAASELDDHIRDLQSSLRRMK